MKKKRQQNSIPDTNKLAKDIFIWLVGIVILIVGLFSIYFIRLEYEDRRARQAVIEEFSATYPMLDKNLLGLELKEQFADYPHCTMGKCSDETSLMNVFNNQNNETIEKLKTKLIKKIKKEQWEITETDNSIDLFSNEPYFYINSKKDDMRLWISISKSEITITIEK